MASIHAVENPGVECKFEVRLKSGSDGHGFVTGTGTRLSRLANPTQGDGLRLTTDNGRDG
jgi:hypothetical protein